MVGFLKPSLDSQLSLWIHGHCLRRYSNPPSYQAKKATSQEATDP